MPRGIVIPWLLKEPMYVRDFNGLSDYQEVVGGYIEALDLSDPEPATMYVDEEGLLKHLDFNVRATMVVMVHNPLLLFTGVNIVGPAIIVGPPDAEGETLDVPESFVQLLMNTNRYKVQVQTADNKTAWNGNQRTFEQLHEAYEYGVNLAHRWMAVERVRVVAA